MGNVNILLNYGIDINDFGSIEEYNNLMLIFRNSFKERYDKLVNFFNNGIFDSYIVEIQSLKVDAKNLGFNELFNFLCNIESKYNNNDFDYIKRNHVFLLEELSKVNNICCNYLYNKEEEKDNNLLSSNDSDPLKNCNDVDNAKNVVIDSTIGNANNIVDTDSEKIHPIVRPKLLKNKILIVDDSKMIRDFITSVLSNDYELIFAGNGQEAIELLKNINLIKNVSSMILDLDMPVLDGYAVLNYMDENDLFNDLPVIVESSIEEVNSLNEINSYPIFDILLKPFEEDDLRRIIEKSFL